jgi:hypothetical protein
VSALSPSPAQVFLRERLRLGAAKQPALDYEGPEQVAVAVVVEERGQLIADVGLDRAFAP